MRFQQPTPILRMFDEAKAREFYVKFLEFKVDWEHRFAPDMPLYMQVSKGNCIIHLSEHHGDASPGSAIRIPSEDLEEYHKLISSKKYKNARPGLNDQPWQCREMQVTDPFHNRLVFFRNLDE